MADGCRGGNAGAAGHHRRRLCRLRARRRDPPEWVPRPVARHPGDARRRPDPARAHERTGRRTTDHRTPAGHGRTGAGRDHAVAGARGAGRGNARRTGRHRRRGQRRAAGPDRRGRPRRRRVLGRPAGVGARCAATPRRVRPARAGPDTSHQRAHRDVPARGSARANASPRSRSRPSIAPSTK